MARRWLAPTTVLALALVAGGPATALVVDAHGNWSFTAGEESIGDQAFDLGFDTDARVEGTATGLGASADYLAESDVASGAFGVYGAVDADGTMTDAKGDVRITFVDDLELVGDLAALGGAPVTVSVTTTGTIQASAGATALASSQVNSNLSLGSSIDFDTNSAGLSVRAGGIWTGGTVLPGTETEVFLQRLSSSARVDPDDPKLRLSFTLSASTRAVAAAAFADVADTARLGIALPPGVDYVSSGGLQLETVPLPGALPLMISAGAGLAWWRRRATRAGRSSTT